MRHSSPAQSASPPATVLRISGLHHAFAGFPPLFDQLTVDLPAGVTWLTGDEGCGKTTLLSILGGATPAQKGQWQWLAAGPTPSMATVPAASSHTPADVAWNDPRNTAHDQHTPRQILAALVPTRPQLPARLDELVTGLSLTEHLDKPLYQLSTGGRRKTFIAATLAQQARLTLLDQPFSALDRPSIHFLLSELRQAANSTDRVWLVADHVAPADVPLALTWVLSRPSA